LVKQGVEVQVAMTEAACHFITPATMQALTGRPVLVNQWDAVNNGMAHIDTSRAADAIVIARRRRILLPSWRMAWPMICFLHCALRAIVRCWWLRR